MNLRLNTVDKSDVNRIEILEQNYIKLYGYAKCEYARMFIKDKVQLIMWTLNFVNCVTLASDLSCRENNEKPI